MGFTVDKKRAELVITPNYAFDDRFSNRWKFTEDNELVNYDCVQNWSDELLRTIYSNLRRAKIRCPPARVHQQFLTFLSRGSQLLEYLEIDRIELTERDMYLTFPSLLKLSIDSIQVAHDFKVTFNANQLQAIYLGQVSMRHLKFLTTGRVTYLEMDHLPSVNQMRRFQNVATLVCNHTVFTQSNAQIVQRLISTFLTIGLTTFHCNLGRLDSILDTIADPLSESPSDSFSESDFDPSDRSYDRSSGRSSQTVSKTYSEMLTATLSEKLSKLSTDSPPRLKGFEGLFRRLLRSRIRYNLNVFINGVQLDLEVPFDKYEFNRPLIDYHSHNYTTNKLVLQPCPTVFESVFNDLDNCVIDLRADPYQTLPGEQRRLGEGEFSLALFSRIYPNIRVVKLKRSVHKPDAAMFLKFLKHCRGLTNLALHSASFTTEFYRRLATLESIRTLYQLYLKEAYGERVEVDFEVMTNMQYINSLQTNMFTRTAMFDAIKRMPIGASFDFRFENVLVAKYPSFCLVQRKLVDQWFVHLVPSPEFNSDQVPQNHHLSSDDLQTYFDDPTVQLITSHWLDDSIPKKISPVSLRDS